LVGALTTSGIAYLGDRNRRHDDKQAATRLVRNEIESDLLTLDFVGHGLRVHGSLASSEWREEQGTLARYLTDKQWNAVSRFYAGVQATEISLKSCRGSDRRGEAASAFDSAHDALLSLGVPRNRLPPRVPLRILENAPRCLAVG